MHEEFLLVLELRTIVYTKTFYGRRFSRVSFIESLGQHEGYGPTGESLRDRYVIVQNKIKLST